MKKLLTTTYNVKSLDAVLLLTRVTIATLMLLHGIPKMQMLFSAQVIQFPPVLGLTPELSLGLAVFAEVFCSILLLVGFGTRLATIPLISTMAVVIFVIHAADPIGKKETAILYLLVYVVLLFSGAGKYSVDHLIQKRNLAITSSKLFPQFP